MVAKKLVNSLVSMPTMLIGLVSMNKIQNNFLFEVSLVRMIPYYYFKRDRFKSSGNN